MSVMRREFRPILRVALPVIVAVTLVCLAIINIVVVRTSRGRPEDGVFWALEGQNVVAEDVAAGSAADRAGIKPRDVLLAIDGREVKTAADVADEVRVAGDGRSLTYVIARQSSDQPVPVVLQPMPEPQLGLYYSLALVGIFSIVTGVSVRLRRPSDQATLHFFWLTVAFFGAMAFTPSPRYDRLDYFFDWADAVARFALPPMFLHFAFVFPDRPNAWIRSRAGRIVLPLVYVPAFALGLTRAVLMARGLHGHVASVRMERIETVSYLYLGLCLVGGLTLMMRALTRLRSVTARRQQRWIVWGSAVGALPFVVMYIVPLLLGRAPAYAEYSAVLLGCIPLAFASALVRYRLMDVEVIIKKALVAASVGLLLVAIYSGTLALVSVISGSNQDESRFWALFATLVVALVAPGLWKAIQGALDRLYYRDRYDYRKALVSFARELNSDLDLDRLSRALVDRVRDTLMVDRMALFLADPADLGGNFVAVASAGFDAATPPPIERASPLAARILAGHTIVIDDPLPLRRLAGDEAASWRHAGLYCFVPCVSKEVTIAVIGVGRKPQAEPLSSEDMALLGAVASQAATALENARLYGQLNMKAGEIERLRQFSDSVVESLSDGLIVVDHDDRVLRWNRRVEALMGLARGRALGRRLPALFERPFVETLLAARRESPSGTTLYRVPLSSSHGGHRQSLLVNAGIAPFQTADGSQAGWILVLEDVTDRANLEEQLRLSEKMAAIGLLAAGVAHEVNTPLTGISSFTQMLLEQSDPDDPRTQLLEKIERQTFRAAKIVSSLLNLARPSDGEAAAVDLNAVIGDVLSLLEHQFRSSRIQVRKDLSDSAVIVRGVEYKLQQVFLNLFLNARDAMLKGGWLSISTRLDGADAVVEVVDTGAGIPAEHVSRIYDPFFTTKPEGRGTGLGLSVTYGIVQEHGGTLSCDSDVGQGTRFRLTLPLADPLATRAVEAASS